MAWFELRLTGVPRRHLDTLSQALFAAGAAGLEECWPDGKAPPPLQPWDEGPAPAPPDPLDVKAWFEDPSTKEVDGVVASLGLPQAPRWSPVEDRDWEAESLAGFPPIVVSPRLTVAPPWNAPIGALLIEPGAGFGTGDHPTTAAALRLLDALPATPPLATALDVGCGSGVLALAAERLGLRATGIDIDPEALSNAEHNARLNGLEATFSTTPVHTVPGPVDVVLANLHAELLVRFAAHLDRLTGHHLILAGILADREHLVRAAFDPLLRLAERRVDGEWISLRYARTSR